MTQNTLLKPIMALFAAKKSNVKTNSASAKDKIYFSRKHVIIFGTAVILFSMAFGIKLAEYLSYVRYDSVSIRFGSMYEYILKTNVSLLESLTEQDKPVRLPSLDNHAYFINFGQVMTHGDPSIDSKVENAMANLRLLQDNYEFFLNTVIPYEVAYTEFIPNQGISRRNPDPIITYNGSQISFSEYRQQREKMINTRKQQIIRLTIHYKQYMDQYMELVSLLRKS